MMLGQKQGSRRGQMIQLSIRLKPGQVVVLDHVARAEGMTVSQIIRKLISDRLTEGFLGDKFDFQIVAGAGPRPRNKKK